MWLEVLVIVTRLCHPGVHACLSVLPSQDVGLPGFRADPINVKLPCTECIIEPSLIECGKACNTNFEKNKNGQGCTIIQCPPGMILAIEDEKSEFSLLNGLLCNSNRRWQGVDWTGPTTVFAKCLPQCQGCSSIQRYVGECPMDQCTNIPAPLLDERGCARMIPLPGYQLFVRVDGELRQTDFLECTSDQFWKTSSGATAETLAISARPTPECAQCSNLHFPKTLLKEYAYYIHDEARIVPETGCLQVTCSLGRQMLLSPTNDPLVAATTLTCNSRRKWFADQDAHDFSFMNIVCGAPSQCAGCNLQVTTDFCPAESCDDDSLVQEYTKDECLQFSCDNNRTLFALSEMGDLVMAKYIQCTTNWRWMTDTGILLPEENPMLGCGHGNLKCGHCPEVSKHTACPSGHVCHPVPEMTVNEFGCARIACERGSLQVMGLDSDGEAHLTCNYEQLWTYGDGPMRKSLGEDVAANCAVASECAQCGLVTHSSECLTENCEAHLETVTDEDCKQIVCNPGQQLFVEVASGDLQHVDRLLCTSLSKEWVSETEDTYGENVKVTCGVGTLKCSSCANLTMTDMKCPQMNCMNIIEYMSTSGCRAARCPMGQTLYIEMEEAEHVVEAKGLRCESDLGWYVDGKNLGPDPSVVCGEGPHLCAMCSNPPYTKECPANAFCDPLQIVPIDSQDECMQYKCKSGYTTVVDDEGQWLNADYLQCTDYDSVIAVGSNFTIDNAIVVTCASECSQCPLMEYIEEDCPVPGFCANRLSKEIFGTCATAVCTTGVLHVRVGGVWRAMEEGVKCDAERRWTVLGQSITQATCTSCACNVDFYNENGLSDFCEGWSECMALYSSVASHQHFSYSSPSDKCTFTHRCPAGYKLLMRLEKPNGQLESLVYEDVHPRDFEIGFTCSPNGQFQFTKRQGTVQTLYGIKHLLCAQES